MVRSREHGPARPEATRRRGPVDPRQMAAAILARIDTEKSYADRLLDTWLGRSELDGRDRALVTELVYGTLRQRDRLDFYLGKYARKPIAALPIDMQWLLRCAAYQLTAMRVPAHAAVGQAVRLVKTRFAGLAPVANAILRHLATDVETGQLQDPVAASADPATGLSIAASQPLWLIRRLLAELGENETRAWVQAHQNAPHIGLRVNTMRASRDTLAQRLRASGAEIEEPAQFPDGLWAQKLGSVRNAPGFEEGDFSVQDLAAQLIGRMIPVRAGMVLLDACAAPGGKATHLAELSRDQAHIVAIDNRPGKLALIERAAQRLHLTCIDTVCADAGEPAALTQVLRDRGHSQVDVALIDAPCSGLGTLRRHPELRRRTEADLPSLCAIQDRLLDNVATAVAPGGDLVYAVCTVTREEGPERIAAFLTQHQEFSLGTPEEPALEAFLESFPDVSGGKILRTWPQRHGCDGFFAALLKRRPEALAP